MRRAKWWLGWVASAAMASVASRGNAEVLTLDPAGGTGGTERVTVTFEHMVPSVVPPVRPQFDFVGYFDDNGGQYHNAAGEGIRVWLGSGDRTLHAHWLEKAEVEWKYRIENGNAIVTDVTPARGNLSIPDTLGGCPVESIGDSAFAGEPNLLGIIIPDTAKNIGSDSFGWCENLASVAISSSVTNIGFGAFQACRGLMTLEIPRGVKVIGDKAFAYCSKLETLTLPDSLTDIGRYAFLDCRWLTSVSIPSGVANIGCGAFANSSLREIQVAEGNRSFAGEDGILFSKDKTTLVCVPGNGKHGSHCEIPASVTHIGDGAFAQCERLASVAVPNGVAAIGEEAFKNCSRLESLAIPDSVANLGRSAFLSCDALKRLEVPGAWWGTSMLKEARVPKGCEVVYRGIEPLAVQTETLPPGAAGEAYRAELAAAGGVEPYTWMAEWSGDYEESAAEGSYAHTGTAREWREDEECWDLPLPFAFPFFGHSYTNAKVNSNGAVSFDDGAFDKFMDKDREGLFLYSPVIAVMWADLTTEGGNIYTEAGSGWVKVVWGGAYSTNWGGGLASCSLTLRKNGEIVLSYGGGNRFGGLIGISAGDGTTCLRSEKSWSGSMENAPDIVFRPGRKLPEGVELTEDGVLRGTPVEGGEHAFSVGVEDAAGVVAWRDVVLAVRPPVTQTVAFDANGGTCATTNRVYTVGEKYGWLPSATRTGNTFLGWYTAATGGVQVTASISVAPAASRTLWARWKAHAYAVTLDARGGSGGTAVVTATYGEAMPAITAPTRRGHDFLGYSSTVLGEDDAWYYTATGASTLAWDRDGDATLYAQWRPSQYAVWLDPGDAWTTGGTESVWATFGEVLPAIDVPTLNGMVFAGYFTGEDGTGTQYYTAEGTCARAWDEAVDTWYTTLYAKWVYPDDLPQTVWRFYSKKYKGHFFTISAREKDGLIAGNPSWKFEGGSYRAYTHPEEGTVALHRFYSKRYRGHFFTINEEEKNGLIAGNPSWKYEGVAYYVYPEEVEGSLPVYRFWSKAYKHHFYTTSAAEKDNLIATNPKWKFETVAFWALPLEGTRTAGAAKGAEADGLEHLKGVDQAGEARGEEGRETTRAGLPTSGRVGGGVVVTTSDGSDGSAVADGDEGTAWKVDATDGAWVVLAFGEARQVDEVVVVGENLPEGMRVLLSEDAEAWREGEGGMARYVWVAFPAGSGKVSVGEISGVGD